MLDDAIQQAKTQDESKDSCIPVRAIVHCKLVLLLLLLFVLSFVLCVCVVVRRSSGRAGGFERLLEHFYQNLLQVLNIKFKN